MEPVAISDIEVAFKCKLIRTGLHISKKYPMIGELINETYGHMILTKIDQVLSRVDSPYICLRNNTIIDCFDQRYTQYRIIRNEMFQILTSFEYEMIKYEIIKQDIIKYESIGCETTIGYEVYIRQCYDLIDCIKKSSK